MSYYDDEIKRLKSEKIREEDLEQYRKTATSTRDMYNAYRDSGFTDEQAYELLTIILKK